MRMNPRRSAAALLVSGVIAVPALVSAPAYASGGGDDPPGPTVTDTSH
jgi:hypothetical protein